MQSCKEKEERNGNISWPLKNQLWSQKLFLLLLSVVITSFSISCGGIHALYDHKLFCLKWFYANISITICTSYKIRYFLKNDLHYFFKWPHYHRVHDTQNLFLSKNMHLAASLWWRPSFPAKSNLLKCCYLRARHGYSIFEDKNQKQFWCCTTDVSKYTEGMPCWK